MENLHEKMVSLLNLRIKKETLSSRLYQQMAHELEYNGFSGAAKLWCVYAKEEMAHVHKVNEFLLDLDYLPEIPSLEKPESFEGNFIEIIKATYSHEQQITKECEQLYLEAMKVGCVKTMGLAQWFVNEQVEELAKTVYWLDRLEAFGTSDIALRELDEEMQEKAEE